MTQHGDLNEALAPESDAWPPRLPKNQLVDLIESTLGVKKFFIWSAMKNGLFFFASDEHKHIIYGLFKM